MEKHKNKSVPIWEKSNLTLTEAAEYFNIGEHKLREITNNHKCNFVLFIGTKRLIKQKEFEKYLEQVSVIWCNRLAISDEGVIKGKAGKYEAESSRNG